MGTGLGTGMGSNWELDAVGANIAGGLSLWGATPLLKSEDPLHGLWLWSDGYGRTLHN